MTRFRWLAVVASAVAGVAALPCVGYTQQPVCPRASPDQEYVISCQPAARGSLYRFLNDFAADHLFKSSKPPFERSIMDIARLAAESVLHDDEALTEALRALPTLGFTRLDSTSGLVSSSTAGSPPSGTGTVEGSLEGLRFTATVPAGLQGGYWRSPAALEIAFWEDRRVRFRVESDGDVSQAVEDEISCIAISASGVRVVTASPQVPDLLVLLQDCP